MKNIKTFEFFGMNKRREVRDRLERRKELNHMKEFDDDQAAMQNYYSRKKIENKKRLPNETDDDYELRQAALEYPGSTENYNDYKKRTIEKRK